ncbi:hypothetical protein SDC9_74949 [bioreactor metagenome]|uniref:Uncharacterized protein n=1 Tax=bioreactor metagenome TaxID=1076179 RepID=A0A644YJF5_9ZZZZ
MRFAVTDDAGERNIVEILPYSVLFERSEHLKQAGSVAHSGNVQAEFLQAFQHFRGVFAQGAVEIGDFPHMCNLFACSDELLPVYRNFAKSIVRPDLLGLEFHERDFRFFLVAEDFRIHEIPKLVLAVRNFDAVLLQNLIECMGGSPDVGVVEVQVLQRTAHVKHDAFDHRFTSFLNENRLEMLLISRIRSGEGDENVEGKMQTFAKAG